MSAINDAGRDSALGRAFLEDHRHMTHGFSELVAALERNDHEAAVRLAADIDRLAGPHIEFEETSFYPTLRRILRGQTIDQLYDEHQEGLDAVRALIERDPERPLADDERAALLVSARTALDHAVSCGSLLSHVASLDSAEQQAMLDELEAARRRGRRWTDLPRHDH